MRIADLSDIERQERPRLAYNALKKKVKEQKFSETQALVFEEEELHQILGTTRKSQAGRHMLARVLSRKLDLRVLYDGIEKQYIFSKYKRGT